MVGLSIKLRRRLNAAYKRKPRRSQQRKVSAHRMLRLLTPLALLPQSAWKTHQHCLTLLLGSLRKQPAQYREALATMTMHLDFLSMKDQKPCFQ